MFDLLDWRLYGRVGTIIAVLKICLVMTLGDFFWLSYSQTLSSLEWQADCIFGTILKECVRMKKSIQANACSFR